MAKTTSVRWLSEWIEDEGTPLARRALICTGPAGSFCAYVGVPADNPLAGRNYDDMDLDCHGGLTFGAEGGGGWPKGWYWYGWDYAHSGDYMDYAPNRGGHRWTLSEIEAETREVMAQLGKMLAEEMID